MVLNISFLSYSKNLLGEDSRHFAIERGYLLDLLNYQKVSVDTSNATGLENSPNAYRSFRATKGLVRI